MKKIFLTIIVLAICISMISCDGMLPGIGDSSWESETYPECGTPYLTDDTTSMETEPPEIEISVDVDWMDFVRIDGKVYNGMFSGITVERSEVSECIGQIQIQVRSSYNSQADFHEANTANYASWLRPVGSMIYRVKDRENAIAVLDGGEYFLYTLEGDDTVYFNVWGGEVNLPCQINIENGKAVILLNTYEEFVSLFGKSAETEPREGFYQKYDWAYFEIKSLVVVRLVSGWGGTEFGISRVEKNGSEMKISAVQLDSSGDGTDDMHDWTFFVETETKDCKTASIDLRLLKPLADDPSLEELSYETMGSYIYPDDNFDFEYYEGTAIVDKYAAEEIARTRVYINGGNVSVFYDSHRNYWIVKLSQYGDGHSTEGTYIIRAADGRIVGGVTAIGCS